MSWGKLTTSTHTVEHVALENVSFFSISLHDSFPDTPRWAALTALSRPLEWHPRDISLGQS